MASRIARGSSKVTTRAPSLFDVAMQRLPVADDLAQLEGRPKHLSTGVEKLDQALRGGLPVGDITLVASRLDGGAQALVMGVALAQLHQGARVAYLSERLSTEEVRGRLAVIEAQRTGHRLAGGSLRAADRVALVEARQRVPWHRFSTGCQRRVDWKDLDRHVFTYRPLLVVADLRLRGGDGRAAATAADLGEAAERLLAMARRHRAAVVVRWVLRKGRHAPELVELPRLGTAVEPYAAVVLAHRVVDPEGLESGHLRAVRVRRREVEPRDVAVRYHHGCLEAASGAR